MSSLRELAGHWGRRSPQVGRRPAPTWAQWSGTSKPPAGACHLD